MSIVSQNIFYYLTFDAENRANQMSKATDNALRLQLFPERQELVISVKGTRNKIQLNAMDSIGGGKDFILRDDGNHPDTASFSAAKGQPDLVIVGIMCDDQSRPLLTFTLKSASTSGKWMVEATKYINKVDSY